LKDKPDFATDRLERGGFQPDLIDKDFALALEDSIQVKGKSGFA
jgi:hypothetical protein